MSNDGWDSIGSTIERVLGTAVLSPILGPLAPVVGGMFGHGDAPKAPAPAPPPGPAAPGPQPPDAHSGLGPTPPPGQLPPPPADPIPGSGGATDRANADASRVADVIAELHDLDKNAAATIDAIHAAGAAGQKQLDSIGKDVNDKITELGPRLNTPAGQQELRDFLKEKLTAAKKVIDQQIADAEEKARHTRELTEKYAGIGGDEASKPGAEPAGHGGGGGAASGGGSDGGSDQGTTPAAAPSAAPGTPPFGQPTMPGAGMMPAGMGMPSIPSLGGGIPGLGGGDPLGALGGLGGGHGAGFHDDDGGLGGDSSKPGGSGLKFHDDDGSTGSGSKPGSDAPGTSPASAGGSAGSGSGAGTELAGNRSGHAGDPGAGQVPATTSVSLPDGETTEARTAQGAAAAKAALGGATVADAWHQSGVTVPPPGTPVTDPIPPTKLKAGDVGIWQDHLVMALGNGKVLVSGQAQPLSSVGSGPDFLGWMDPSALAPKGSGPAAPSTPPTPPTPPAQPS